MPSTIRTIPAVLAMIRMAAENAHAEGKWIGICGELGADLELTEEFLKYGIRRIIRIPCNGTSAQKEDQREQIVAVYSYYEQ